MRRTYVPPRWDKLTGRSPMFKKDNTKIYLNHEPPLKNIGKTFIDMDKQTMRGDVITGHELRIITTKTFVSKNKKKRKKVQKDENSESVMESEYSALNKNNHNMFMKYENNYVKGKKKRVQSAVTSSTRPQTGNPKINTLTTNNSKQINNTSNSICGKNITMNSKNINTNVTNINNSLSEENIEIYSVSSSELNDSYSKFKNVYQRQIKSKFNQNVNRNRKSVTKNNTPIKDKVLKKNRTTISKNDNKYNRPKSSKIYTRKLNMGGNRGNNLLKKKNKIKGPDFDKTISRKYYEN
jgi:hypothetical protein